MSISEQIFNAIASLDKDIKREIGFYDHSSVAKIPFRLEVYVHALSQRIINHSEAVVALYKQNLIIPAFGVIRSNFESLAVLNRIKSCFGKSLELNRLDPELDNLLESVTLGTREKGNPIQAINVLSQLDKMEREWKGIRLIYDTISEFVHPNCDGVIVSYSEIRPELGFSTIKPQENEGTETAIAAFRFVPAQLAILSYFVNYFNKNMALFAILCEEDIKVDLGSQRSENQQD